MITLDLDKPSTYVAIGQRLRWAREAIYRSQAEFARAIGVDKSTVNKIEAGERTLSIVNLIVASEKLRCGADFLLTGKLFSVDPDLRQLLIQLHPQLLEPLDPPDPSDRPASVPTLLRLRLPEAAATGQIRAPALGKGKSRGSANQRKLQALDT